MTCLRLVKATFFQRIYQETFVTVLHFNTFILFIFSSVAAKERKMKTEKWKEEKTTNKRPESSSNKVCYNYNMRPCCNYFFSYFL